MHYINIYISILVCENLNMLYIVGGFLNLKKKKTFAAIFTNIYYFYLYNNVKDKV
jgi:hypothetical protein